MGQLKIYDAQNALAEQINGFSAPRDLLWTGSEFLFADGAGAILSWTPGHHPRRVGSGRTANYLAWRGGVLYLSDLSAISTLAANGSLPSYYSLSGLSNLSGLAVRPDGALTLAGNSDSRVLTLDPARQIVASYAGFSSPGALAVDGADNVFVASEGTQEIVKIDPAGRRSDVFAVSAPTSGLAFDGSGQLYGVNATTVYRFSATGTRTTVASDSGAVLSRLAFDGASILATSPSNSLAYRVQGSGLVPFAAGLSGTVGVRRGPDGALYVASQNNGSVARYADGALGVQAAGLPGPRRLAFGPSGTLYVAGNSGNVMAIAAGGARTDLKLEPTLGTDGFDGITVDSQGTVRLTRPNRNDVVAFAEPIPVEIPAAGTVVYTLPVDLAALPVSGDSLALALGNWTPEFSGDYEVRLRSGQAGVEGALVNTLHVGPHANAQMSIDRTTVAPTRDGVGVSLTVEGADFTSLAKVDTANLVRSVSSGAYPSAMGADAAGNIYFASGGAVRKVDPAGVVTTFAAKSTSIRGQIPVDSAQNLYISDGNSNRLLRLAPDGTGSLLATLSSNIVSLAIDTRDNLFALTSNQIVKIAADGGQSVVTTAGITSPFSLTIDGKGNLYVQNYGNIINRVASDGRVSTLPTTGASFEYEGNNIAGDCADNLFLTPFSWPQVGQSGEEHTLVQLIGRSGQAAAILDGRTVNPDLGDMDFIIYDRFGGNLLIWTDYNGGRIYKLPVTCGAIGTELHVVLPQGQTAEGLTPAPTAVLARPDGSAEYLWNLKDVTALGRTVRFDTALENLVLGEERRVAEDAYLVFQNSFVPGEVRVPIAIPKVRVENLVGLSVATDQPTYPENTEVLIDVELENANLHTVDGLAVVEIEDALGVRVANVLAEPAAIAAEDRSTLAPVFHTGHYQAGEYTVRAYLRDAEGADLASGSSRFRIVAGDGSGALLDASVSTGQAVYPPYATVVISSQVRNLTGNLLLDGLTVNETVTDPSGQAVFTASRTMPQLVGGHLEESSFSFPLVAAATGDYTVTQTVTAADGTLLDTRTAGFTVESTADTGFGLSGRLTVTPTPVPLGTPFTLSYTAENLGNADLSGVPLILRLIDPAAGSLIQEWRKTADLPRSVPYSGNQTDAGSDLVAGQTYAAVLSAVVGGSERVLARTTIPVVAAPLPIRLEVNRQARAGRVLVLLSCQGDEDDTAPAANPDGTPPPAPCLESRFALVDRVLTELDVRHRIVTTAEDFRRAFRSGVYDSLWLSGGRVKLDHDLSREVREAVFRGEGLLIDGQHDERNRLLDEAGGFLYRGQLGTPDLPVEFSQAPFISQTLRSKGRGLRLELAGGSAVAGFPEGTPAVVRNLYGLGRSLAFGFDLPESLAAEASQAAWREVLGAALAEIQPAVPAAFTGGAYVQQRFTVENLAEAVTGLFRFRLPEGAQLAEADPTLAAEADGAWLWRFELPAGEARRLDLGLRLPPTDGVYGFTAQLEVEQNGVTRPYGDYSFELTVATATADLAGLRADLAAYSPARTQDRQRRDRAVAALDQAEALAVGGDWERAIGQLLDAIDLIAQLPAPEVPGWRQRLGRRLLEYGWRSTQEASP